MTTSADKRQNPTWLEPYRQRRREEADAHPRVPYMKAMRAAGATYREIGEACGISRQFAWVIVNRR